MIDPKYVAITGPVKIVRPRSSDVEGLDDFSRFDSTRAGGCSSTSKDHLLRGYRKNKSSIEAMYQVRRECHTPDFQRDNVETYKPLLPTVNSNW